MQWTKRMWRGEERLWKVFWIYQILSWVLPVVLDKITEQLLSLFMVPSSLFYALGNYLSGVIFLCGLVCVLLTAIATWKCAFNTDHRAFAYAARILTVLIAPCLFYCYGFLTLWAWAIIHVQV